MTIRSLALAPALAALALAATPARPALADARPASPLDRLLGTWKATGTATMGPDQVRVAATWACKAVSAGAGVGCTLRLTGLPGMVYQETDLFGVDPGTATMHWFSVTNAGEVHDHAATAYDGLTWRFAYAGSQDGKPTTEAITMVFGADGRTFKLTSEATLAGALVSSFAITAHK